jgi:Ni,Fe-hydrogenase III large subunit
MLYSRYMSARRRHPPSARLCARKERPTTTVFFPLGPYSPATAQPFAVLLRLRGETIVGVEPPEAGYCRRGIAALIEGRTVDAALPVVEHSCSFAGSAHRLALCRALESAAQVTPSHAATATRVLFAEVERVLARLWTLGFTARGLNLAGLWQAALQQREELQVALEEVTGSRAFWGIATPGGARDALDLDPLRTALETLDPSVTAWRVAAGPQGLLGRAGKGVGRVSEERARALGLRGLAGAGSYPTDDLRATGDDGDYAELDVAWPSLDGKRTGDVAARLSCAVEDMATSLEIAKTCLNDLPAGEATAALPLTLPAQSSSLRAAVEGPHGPATLTATRSAAGTLAAVRLDTPAQAVVDALPELLEGRPLAHALPTLASMDLCLECLDQ